VVVVDDDADSDAVFLVEAEIFPTSSSISAKSKLTGLTGNVIGFGGE